MHLLSTILVWIRPPQQEVLLEISVIVYFIGAVTSVSVEMYHNALGKFLVVFYVGLHVFDTFPLGIYSLGQKHVD